jgi:mono/diheme cytochrome c family protein
VSAPLVATSLTLVLFIAAGCDSTKKRSACGQTFTNEAEEVLASQQLAAVCRWHLPSKLAAGARVFVASGCTACHRYRGIGTSNVGGSDLTSVGRRHGRRYLERFVRNPAAYGNDVMPPFRALGAARLRQLGLFLAASKGAG